MTTLT